MADLDRTTNISEYPTSKYFAEDAQFSNWYVFKTKPHAEIQVDSLLGSRQIVTYLPLLRRRNRFEPLFPGYLFVKVDLSTDQYMRSRSVPGVSYILNADGMPIAIDEEIVEHIRQRVEGENIRPAARFASGDSVVITAGPFRGLDAIFDRAVTPQGRCLVLLKMLGQMSRVQVSVDQLAKAGIH